VVGVFLLKFPEAVNWSRFAMSSLLSGREQHFFSGVDYFSCFSHEVNPNKYNNFGGGSGRFLGQGKAIAHKI
jgi:hypothetical protein